jgi:hypothetical protein
VSNIDEITKKIALERVKPSSAVDRIAQEAIRRHLETRSALDTHALRVAQEALAHTWSNPAFRAQVFEPINALRKQVGEMSLDILNQGQVAQRALSAILSNANLSRFRQSQEIIAQAALNSVNQFYTNLNRDLFASFRAALHRDLDPMLAAIGTMRSLGLENLSPEFSEYVSETLEEFEESNEQQIPKTSAEILETTTKVFEQKAKGLSEDQKFKLMLALTVLSIFIALYQAIQAGQPIKIDPIQLEQLKGQPEITLNIYNIFSRINEQVEYQVERKVALKLKPKNCSTTMVTLEIGEKVKLIRLSHKWIYVEYHDEEEDLPVYGWANKKYLKRIK